MKHIQHGWIEVVTQSALVFKDLNHGLQITLKDKNRRTQNVGFLKVSVVKCRTNTVEIPIHTVI